MAKVKSTRIGDSLKHADVLYGPMLSEKYAVDFLKGIDIVEADGATKLWGQGRIATGSTPENFQGSPEGGVFMWPHVYACLLYTSPSPRDRTRSRMPSSA